MEPYPDPRDITHSSLLSHDCQSQIFFKGQIAFHKFMAIGTKQMSMFPLFF